ncbi:MAG: HD domain-containing phosphohydrolase [Patescibacteria group bacterium]
MQLSLRDENLPRDYSFFLKLKKPYVNRNYPILKKFFHDSGMPFTLEFPLIAGKHLLGIVSVDNAFTKRNIDTTEADAKISPLVNHIALNFNRIIAEEKIREANRNLKEKVTEATTELKNKNTELEHLANFDDLSRLPNRRAFEKKLEEEFKKAGSQRALSLAMIDIDFLKHLNDTRGHEAGDRLITKVGEILSRDKKIDFAARFAGDEFVFLLIKKSKIKRNQILTNLIAKIKKATGHSVSIGCAGAPQQMIKSTIDLMRRADDALYHAKHTGRSRFVCADDDTEHIAPLTERRADLQAIEQQGTFAIDYIRQLRMMNQLAELMRKNVSEKEIAKKIAQRFCANLGFKRAGVFLQGEVDQKIHFVAQANFDIASAEKIIPAQTLSALYAQIKKIMQTRRVVELSEKKMPAIVRKLLGINRVLIVPLIGRTVVLGAIIAECEPNKIFRKSDFDFYLTLGDQVETGLVKMRALKSIQNFNQKLKKEIGIATHKLQKYAHSLEEQIADNADLREKERRTHFELISSLVTSLDEKDVYTRGHSVRVASYAVKLGRIAGLSEARLSNLRYAGLLHDVGKVAIDQSVLNKHEALTENETQELEKHPIIGQKIVSGVKFLAEAGHAIRHHHERWDGSGYPDHLAKKQIPLEARVLAIADSYDAMVTRRSYGQKMSRAEAIRELELGSGKQFDPELAKIFIRLLKQGKIRTPQKTLPLK